MFFSFLAARYALLPAIAWVLVVVSWLYFANYSAKKNAAYLVRIPAALNNLHDWLSLIWIDKGVEFKILGVCAVKVLV